MWCPLCLNAMSWRHVVKVEVKLHIFLTSALSGGVSSALCICFIPGERAFSAHWIWICLFYSRRKSLQCLLDMNLSCFIPGNRAFSAHWIWIWWVRVSLANRKIVAYAGTKIWLSGIDWAVPAHVRTTQ